MCFGGETETRTIVQNTSNQLPQWMSEAGESQYGIAQQQAGRPYPLYNEPRIAEFSPDTLRSFDLARQTAGSWQPAFDQAMGFAQQAGQPVGQADIEQYMNPYTRNVIDTTVEEMNRQFNRDRIGREDMMVNRGSFYNEDRKGAIENLARESQNRNMAAIIAQLQMGNYSQALQQANVTRGQQAGAAGMFGQLAPLGSQLAYTDIAGLGAIGTQQQQQEQQNLGLGYQDFLNQFYYPEQQTNWVSSIIGGTPYTTQQQQTGNQFVPMPNTFAQNLGGLGALFGGIGLLKG